MADADAPLSQDVRIHDRRSASYQQSLDVALTKASVSDIADYAGPFVKQLFQAELDGDFPGWLADAVGDLPTIGNALLALDVTPPPEACLAWTKAPTDSASDVYQRMSLALQARYRQLVHDVFFSTIDSFEDVAFGSGAFAVLVFSSLTPATDARISGRRLELAPGQVASTAVHWDLQDRGLLKAVARTSRVRATLMARLDSVAEADIVRSETLVHVAG